ncbi:hypothetical protein GDO81_009470 [Engystomops pustulosus]|uniref:Uncharacterized protein n=1 Tax=Engystomops pustulosus TaxID=76066 RepID=A0AAV7BSL6_ENGPU|nr:hypothetical protein GDO81_009470 [Engystomops pustulosus]
MIFPLILLKAGTFIILFYSYSKKVSTPTAYLNLGIHRHLIYPFPSYLVDSQKHNMLLCWHNSIPHCE